MPTGGILAPGDKYNSFAELAGRHREGQDWRHIVVSRHAAVAMLAPHGGGIEPGTSELAIAIAGDEFSLYCFEGLRRWRNARLHIASTRFDDPACLELLQDVPTAIVIHGCAERREIVYLGGLHAELRTAAEESLAAAGFRVAQDTTIHGGTDQANLCNRCAGGRGLQVELSRGMRASMFAGLRPSERQVRTAAFAAFVAGMRAILPLPSAPALPAPTPDA